MWEELDVVCWTPFFFDSSSIQSAPIQFDFTYIKWSNSWVLLMWGVRTLWGAIITDKNYKIENLHTDVAYWCLIATAKWDHVSLFLESMKIFLDSSTLVYICRNSSSDSSTLVYTRLVTRLHLSSESSALVYIRLNSSVTRPHSSSLLSTRLMTRLYF